MESEVHQEKSLPSQGLKQVKVDNWGIFFLQRLQQLYAEEQLLDLKIKFPTSNIIVQAHRLVLTTCTDYFMQLEQQQKGNEDFDGIITMPSDMPYECVKSIISFMYTGQLEYWTLEQQSLYRTAQKMNMAVLTKLLDAQFNTSSSHTDAAKPPVQPAVAVSKPSISAPKPLTSSISSTSTLPEQPLPGKKLPIWKRKLDDAPSVNYEAKSFGTLIHKPEEITPGPSRFDLPEADDIALGIFSSFDDITYDTKPIVQASDKYKKENSSGKRSLEDDNKNDTTEDEEEEGQGNEKSLRDTNSDDDWSISKNFHRSQDDQPKRVRFDLEEKENVEKSKSNQQQSTEDSISNHAKIIKEVLKKYPHLVKNKNNIRLKIMQKEAKSSDSNGKTKVSYVVLKSDHLLSSNNDDNDSKCNGNIDGEKGPWKCNKCDLDEEYTNYYMYRRHMQDVHEEKFDPRVCEHCGYKASKRNLLMYHLYTKHNVPPPKSMHFPKCHACSYVALSENLLVRHQINYKHRPASRQHPFPSEEIQCSQCNESFRSITELTTHELNTGHGNATDGKETKGHRCSYCGKHFVRLTNLQIHLDCVHKELQRDAAVESASPVPSIPLEPSSEAEALSHVVSGIAASLGVEVEESASETQDRITTVKSTDNQYVVPDMEIEMMDNTCSYSEVEGQHMIMLVDTDGKYRQTENEHHQQPQQLDIADNEQIVMQGTDDGMIVYIHGAEQTDHRSYENYQSTQVTQEAEEVVEEVVEEVEEELIEEEEEEEVVQKVPQNTVIDDSADNQVQEVIQYVEEQTEIVEYDEEQCIDHSIDENQESVMIIEEEHVEDVEETDN
ncbi:centrosome-associated zinc finger protein CP190-like [Pseudomyrmex gracilis]|uniref:centrosome-associated zinc finger protein CP190-like n=1 Tax=Pseudomyrmex gracilis TaxID=219809 RepID=UPI000995D83A|nr:centrosome-associated zinc finger protein CP190-like [Pseudomyrmex gracilis]XP_020279580.1 centrosome-associated zinc finger protein CP190-like [Pseudomyrmex gracilis]XP_020279581.1 centrosome-associated zinc finger protein CP190-like [Pseudomyrmex gracilis]XP_020279582.1 centrosome-associated zinc finger protein CP190-like [Pseudomyrmex gracilis]